jgi:hypothetical protein
MAGTVLQARMKRRPVDIVCPIFYTKETVNVAMLKRLLKELSYDDSRVYLIAQTEKLREAYEVAKSTVKAHDVRFVREFIEDDPFKGEAWFYGEVNETGERLVIRTSVDSDIDFLEIYVASSNLASLTGLLAELGSVFRKKIEEKGIEKDEILLQSDETAKEVVKQTRLLLDKFAESEVEPGELDQ